MDQSNTRAKAEERLTRFLVNIFYFYDIWKRVRTVAENLQLVEIVDRDEQRERMRKEMDTEQDEYGDRKTVSDPHGFMGYDNDIFSQEFFLLAYVQVMKKSDQFVESAEGHTYMRFLDQQACVRVVLQKMRGELTDFTDW